MSAPRAHKSFSLRSSTTRSLVFAIPLLFLFYRLALIASHSSPIYIALHNEQGQGLGLIHLIIASQDKFPSLSYRDHPCETSLLSARPPSPNAILNKGSCAV